MQLSSRLRDTTLGDLLALMHRNNASGVLELLESRSRHAIHLRRGYVQAVESECATLRLGDVATRRWGIGRISVERARMYAHSKGIKIGQALVEAGQSINAVNCANNIMAGFFEFAGYQFSHGWAVIDD